MSAASGFDPAEYIRLAEHLATQTHDEACLRAAMGRAYYGLFLIALSRLNVKTKKGESVHKVLIAAVRAKDPTAGNQLDKIRRMRVTADYYPDRRNSGTQQWQQKWEVAAQLLPSLRNRIESLRP